MLRNRPRGVSDVWQAKGLREGIFGSVAVTGLTDEFSEVWQGKNLRNREVESLKLKVEKREAQLALRGGWRRRKDIGEVRRTLWRSSMVGRAHRIVPTYNDL